MKNQNTRDLRAKNYKSFIPQLEAILSIAKVGTMPITVFGYEQCQSELIKNHDSFVLKVEGIFQISDDGIIPIILNEQHYTVTTSEAKSNSVNINELSGITRTQTFDIYNIESAGFTVGTPQRFRCFFPAAIEDMRSFSFLLETIIYETDSHRYSFDCIRINVGEVIYDVVQVKTDDAGYYMIESLENETDEAFNKKCFAIQQTLGFLTGYMPGGEQYLFAADVFKYSRFIRPELKSFYYPVNSNPYSRLHHKKEVAETYKGKLSVVPSVTMSNLVNLIREKEEISMAVILLMEATSVKSLLLIPSVFAVIIESLAKCVSVTEKGMFTPIADAQLSKDIIEAFLKVVDANVQLLSEDGALKLKRRLMAINNPMVKDRLTNNEKLTMPFEQLGIKLSIEDIMAIEHRNDLLHGNISLKNDLRSPEMVNDYMVYVMDRLYTLISKLLLKLAGFEGYVINYARFSEERIGIESGEGYFVEI